MCPLPRCGTVAGWQARCGCMLLLPLCRCNCCKPLLFACWCLPLLALQRLLQEHGEVHLSALGIACSSMVTVAEILKARK